MAFCVPLYILLTNMSIIPTDLPEKRNDMAAAISKEQERLEKKRQRKMEKKLAKQEKELQSNPEHSKKTAKAKVSFSFYQRVSQSSINKSSLLENTW